jgi:ATP-binding cassette, subfamily B (MDR/TAP), member 1
MTDVFVIGGNTLVDKAIENRNIFLYIGAGAFVAGWISFACWIIVGERMAIRCRKAYLSSLLKQ